MSSSSISSSQATFCSPLKKDPSVLFIAKHTPEIKIVVPEYYKTIANVTAYIPIQLKSYSTFRTFVSVEANTSDPLIAMLSPQFSYNLLPNEAITLLAWYYAASKGESQLLLSFRFKELDVNATTEEITNHNFICVHVNVVEPFVVQTIPEFSIEHEVLVCKPKLTLGMMLNDVNIQSVKDDVVKYDFKGCCITQRFKGELSIKPITIKTQAPARASLLTEFKVDYFILNNASLNLAFSLDALSDAFCNVGCRPITINLEDKESEKVTLTYLAIKLGRYNLPSPSISFQITDSIETDFIGGFIDVFP